MRFVGLYALTVLGFLVIDFVWLTVVAQRFYQKHLGSFLREDPIVAAAAFFYLLYLVGVLVFVVLPALEAESFVRAVALGALFGLIAYATFDLTCYALFEGFPVIVVVVDLVWGAVLTASVSAIGYAAGRWLGF
ncbi:MAG: DUF2177 family protein [Longimicrobiales bacterium]|nr:DUF2177 family protein [Longimicrobiales bacterium]